VQNDKEKILQPLKGWNEVAEKAAAGDVMILPFLKMARTFTDGTGKIYIRFPNKFAKEKVDNSETMNGILAALCQQLDRKLTQADVILEISETQDDFNDLDDLNI
jgi:hypothetical protein